MTILKLFPLVALSLTSLCLVGCDAEDDIELTEEQAELADELAEHDEFAESVVTDDEYELAAPLSPSEGPTCVNPPVPYQSLTVPSGGDVGNGISYTTTTSGNGSWFVNEFVYPGKPNQDAYASHAQPPALASCASARLESKFFCFSPSLGCWYVCKDTSTRSGTVFKDVWGNSYCDATTAMPVPSGVSKVRIQGRAWTGNVSNAATAKKITVGARWHY